MSPIALLSVSDKTGLIPLAQALVNELGFKIISSGGTAKLIESENLYCLKSTLLDNLRIKEAYCIQDD